MFIAAGMIVGLFLFGLVVTVLGFTSAPAGYEDETGFNITWTNHHADVSDVSCVWGAALAAGG